MKLQTAADAVIIVLLAPIVLLTGAFFAVWYTLQVVRGKETT